MIEVSISNFNVMRGSNDVTRGVLILGALREAGIPIIGSTFTLAGVERGVLSYWNEMDLDGTVGDHMYRWQEDTEDRSKFGSCLRVKLKHGVAKKYGRHAVVPEEDDEL